MLAGKLFHTRGPATTKLHVPSTVVVLGTTRQHNKVMYMLTACRLGLVISMLVSKYWTTCDSWLLRL